MSSTDGFQLMDDYDYLSEETAQVIDVDGWLHTGDLGTMDKRGYLWITGRLRDMIIRGGMNLYPGKIQKFRLSELIAEGKLQPVAGSPV